MGEIVSFPKACILSRKLRKNSLEVVFTHGCFDILHLGHINLFRKSKKMGNYLFVGVLTDRSVSYFKKGRPVMGLNERLKIVASLLYVDYAFPMPIKLGTKEEIIRSHTKVYEKLKAGIVTSGVNDRSWLNLKKMQAEATGSKFVSIDSGVRLDSSKIIRKIVKIV